MVGMITAYIWLRTLDCHKISLNIQCALRWLSESRRSLPCSFRLKDTHPPAAAAWRQVLPRLSGVSIWKPAHRTESLLRVQIMLYLRPERGLRHEEEGQRPQHNTQTATVEDPGEFFRKRNTGIEEDKKKVWEKERKSVSAGWTQT